MEVYVINTFKTESWSNLSEYEFYLSGIVFVLDTLPVVEPTVHSISSCSVVRLWAVSLLLYLCSQHCTFKNVLKRDSEGSVYLSAMIYLLKSQIRAPPAVTLTPRGRAGPLHPARVTFPCTDRACSKIDGTHPTPTLLSPCSAPVLSPSLFPCRGVSRSCPVRLLSKSAPTPGGRDHRKEHHSKEYDQRAEERRRSGLTQHWPSCPGKRGLPKTWGELSCGLSFPMRVCECRCCSGWEVRQLLYCTAGEESVRLHLWIKSVHWVCARLGAGLESYMAAVGATSKISCSQH